MRRPSLQEIYNSIPDVKLPCENCGQCCGNIFLTKLEMKNIMTYCEEHKIQLNRPAVLVPNRDTKKVIKKLDLPQTQTPQQNQPVSVVDKLEQLTTVHYVSTTIDDRVRFNIRPGESCPLLGEDNKCTVYPVRPFICRLYGHVKGLSCEEKPAKDYTFTEAQANRLCRQAREAWR